MSKHKDEATHHRWRTLKDRRAKQTWEGDDGGYTAEMTKVSLDRELSEIHYQSDRPIISGVTQSRTFRYRPCERCGKDSVIEDGQLCEHCKYAECRERKP